MNFTNVLTLGGYVGKIYDYVTGVNVEQLPHLDRISVAALFALYPTVEPETRLTFADKKVFFQRPFMVHSPATGEAVGNLQGLNRALHRKSRTEVGTLISAVKSFREKEVLEDSNNKYIGFFLTEGLRSYMKLYPEGDNAHECLELLADSIDAELLSTLQIGNAKWEALNELGNYLKVNTNDDKSHKTLGFLRSLVDQPAPVVEEGEKKAEESTWEASYFYKELSFILSKKEGWESRRDAFIYFIENGQPKG